MLPHAGHVPPAGDGGGRAVEWTAGDAVERAGSQGQNKRQGNHPRQEAIHCGEWMGWVDTFVYLYNNYGNVYVYKHPTIYIIHV